MLTGLTMSVFAISGVFGNNISNQQELFLFRAVIWSIQFLVMFQSVIMIPWLFNNKELDIYLRSSTINPLPIVLGRIFSVTTQQIVLSLILSIMSIVYFIIVLKVNISFSIVFSIIISLLIALLLISSIIFGVTLFIQSFSSSIFVVNSILSLYLFGLPLFMIINISYGLLPGEFNFINLALQLQSVNNALISNQQFYLSSIDPLVFVTIISELALSSLLIYIKGRSFSVR
jgi:hypothetical protein